MAHFGKLMIEFWDVSGDLKYEKVYGPIQQDANGIIFVYDPNAPKAEEILIQFVNMFPKQMGIHPKNCMIFVNNHNVAGGTIPNTTLPKSFDHLVRHDGTAEESSGIFQGFEKYLNRVLKVMSEQQKGEEDDILQ